MTSEPPSSLFVLFHRADLDQRGVRAVHDYAAGTTIATFGALRWHPAPHRMTLQVSAHRHFELDPVVLESINHGCDPNVHFDVDRFELIALRDIAAGDELTFFYPASEWSMESPFVCGCGAARCLGEIRGARFIAAELLANYRLSSFVAGQLAAAAIAATEGEPSDELTPGSLGA